MRTFVDTNVLVYARDASEPEKQDRASAWLAHLWRSRSGRTSTQVLQEYYVTVTRKLKPGLPNEEARSDIRALMAWRPATVNGALIEDAWRVQDRYGLSFWDALIVSAAQATDCRYLLTEDLQEGQDLDGVQVRNPFLHTPESVSESPTAG